MDFFRNNMLPDFLDENTEMPYPYPTPEYMSMPESMPYPPMNCMPGPMPCPPMHGMPNPCPGPMPPMPIDQCDEETLRHMEKMYCMHMYMAAMNKAEAYKHKMMICYCKNTKNY